MEPDDKNICKQHRAKKTLFCNQCLVPMCGRCYKKHDQAHEIWTVEEAAEFVISKFRQGLVEVKRLQNKLEEATLQDPTILKCSTPCVNDFSLGCANAFEYGNSLIDSAFKEIKRELTRAKKEMKQKFLEAYLKVFSKKVTGKAQQFN
mmetsp:Transcript_2350/g.1689  ORF Transcript_2350/g.1689 Transcript_2350/m.1689 type:complete len:148 (-) Transcript_2350:817-1260(-)